MSRSLRRLRPALPLALPLLFLIAIVLSLASSLLAQVADTSATIPPPSPQMQFVLGLGFLAAFIGKELASFLVSLWNKAGGWLDGKSNGFKQAIAMALTGTLGLLINAIAGALTHATNWMVSFGLSIAASIVGIVNASVTIDAAKSKMAAKANAPAFDRDFGSKR